MGPEGLSDGVLPAKIHRLRAEADIADAFAAAMQVRDARPEDGPLSLVFRWPPLEPKLDWQAFLEPARPRSPEGPQR